MQAEAELLPNQPAQSSRQELLLLADDEAQRLDRGEDEELVSGDDDGEEAGKAADEESDEESEQEEEDEKCFTLLLPHKMQIGKQQKGSKGGPSAAAAVSLTGMAFSSTVEALLVTTKLSGTGGQEAYAVTQLHPTTSSSRHQQQQRHTRHYRPAGLEHRGPLGLASRGRDAPGQLVCAGAGPAIHGVFLLQALAGAGSQPVLSRCCGPPGSRLGQFNRPAGCAVDADSVWVADQLNHRLQRLALPTLAPLAELRHPRLLRPNHVTVLADPHFAVRLLLVAHERGVLAFDLLTARHSADGPQPSAVTEFARSRSPIRRWGGLCVHWGAVLLADQAANCLSVYRYRPAAPLPESSCLPHPAASFSLVQRIPLAPLGLCLPRHLATHRWLDLLYLAAHDTRDSGGEMCLLTAQMVRVQQKQQQSDVAEADK
ncbi:hypothetical protein BOX15_Mlig031307g1 [Macrostomum lignano]|uniref:Uncharacterized protein n=1 Tax=Macrostomum lignano TaxID=282301 RepID=A0A267FBX5_9PLAT|nr:hypothetical protein BOX15_Mlig031307g1 [Macrostomum lignano]